MVQLYMQQCSNSYVHTHTCCMSGVWSTYQGFLCGSHTNVCTQAAQQQHSQCKATVCSFYIYVRISTALTRRNEGELDCIALDEVAQYFISALDEVSIQCSYTVNTSDCCGMFCRSFNSVVCTREGSGKDFTTLQCPIVYPLWG